jgi:hypothetical protein
MRVCQCCSRLFPAGQLLTACSCQRETCLDCLIPTYVDQIAGPAHVVGYICTKCAARLIGSGRREPVPLPPGALS